MTKWGNAGLNNGGPHGFSEMLYAFSSATGNNGSAFAGLTANPTSGDFAGNPNWDIMLGMIILVGRFFMMIPVLALAGRLVKKKPLAQGVGSFPVTGPTFVVLLVSTVLIVGALTFFPALALGPIVEHYLMGSGKLY
jgi:K+-transporting ATPase ATPase A chain